ncbi:uncharacterized protein LOC121048643 [Ixodes scapularis]|uniref:uncharacterized protein LOC121048643 n=1 Tax=Ixodes scapularis TaxID=6945 RepID=UPI001AD73AEC|nr:uncharacterized protein LOC121048643 [Ixodes scapularis]
MEYFVYVKFLFDKVKKVTTSGNVKRFHPEHAQDFNPGDVYSVYWEGDDRTRGGYYEAELLHMTDCECHQRRTARATERHCPPEVPPPQDLSDCDQEVEVCELNQPVATQEARRSHEAPLPLPPQRFSQQARGHEELQPAMGPPVCREEAPAVERAIGAVTGDGKVHLSNEP